MSKRFNFKDDFEMLYLRHEYIKKVKQFDPTMIEKYANIVSITAKIMFNRLTNFEKVGFTEEDIVAITNIYMLSYMALYSIQNNPKELERTLIKRKVDFLSPEEIQRIDRNHLINFLRQRIHHLGTLCARKARNITAGIDRRGIFAETEKSQPVSKEMILNDYEKYGYRKVKIKEYEDVTKHMENTGEKKMIDANGFKIFKIETFNDGISKEDYKTIMESNISFTYQRPDIILEQTEDEQYFNLKREQFNKFSEEKKGRILSSFIRKNKKNKRLKKELILAKKKLKEKTIVV